MNEKDMSKMTASEALRHIAGERDFEGSDGGPLPQDRHPSDVAWDAALLKAKGPPEGTVWQKDHQQIVDAYDKVCREWSDKCVEVERLRLDLEAAQQDAAMAQSRVNNLVDALAKMADVIDPPVLDPSPLRDRRDPDGVALKMMAEDLSKLHRRLKTISRAYLFHTQGPDGKDERGRRFDYEGEMNRLSVEAACIAEEALADEP